ncbi:MAG: cbb3-type cytochrome c oxidase subunit I [Pseudomonadota bacterium]
MLPETTLAAFLTLLPLAWGTWRGWTVHALLITAGLGLAAAGAAAAFLLARTLRLTRYHDRAYHDTYYVVAHGHWLLSLALAFAALAALHWAAHRFATPLAPRLTRIAVWAFTLGLLAPQILRVIVIAPPRRYVDYEPWVQILLALNTAGSLVCTLALLVLLPLPLYALLFRRAR